MSNFSIGPPRGSRAAGLPTPHANQIELHPWSQKPELVDYLNATGIAPIAYSSLVPLSTWRTADGARQRQDRRDEGRRARRPTPVQRAGPEVRRDRGAGAAALGVQQGYPVLPKSTNPERIRKNADLFSFALDET